MHQRNSEILAPVMRAYASKDQQQPEKPRPADTPRREQDPPRPRQLTLLDK